MGEYNGGARKRVPSLTEQMAKIREEHAKYLRQSIFDLMLDVANDEAPYLERIDRIARDAIRNAVAATELAVNEDNRTREARAAQAKQDAKIKMFHRPGRFGHG
jgi:hypothetical protein